MTSPRPTASSPADELRTLVETFYDAYLELHPIEATYIGDHRFDDVLGNPASPDHHAQLEALYVRSLKAARSIDASGLSETDRLTLEIFTWDCEQALALRKFPIGLLPLNQMDSLASTLAQLGSGDGAQPFDTLEDHRAWLRRASQFPAWVDAAILQMRAGQAQGVTYPAAAMEELVAQLDALATPDLEQSLFMRPLRKLAGPSTPLGMSGDLRSGRAESRPDGDLRSSRAESRPDGDLRSGRAESRPDGDLRSGRAESRPIPSADEEGALDSARAERSYFRQPSRDERGDSARDERGDSARDERGDSARDERKPTFAPSEVEVRELEAQYREIIGGQVLPAYARLRDFIRDEHLPACRRTVGWSSLPQGAAWYQRQVERNTTTPLSPEEIHQQGLKEVARIKREMEQVKQQVGFGGDLLAFFAYVREDSRFYFQNPEALVRGYQALKARIDGLLPKLFSDFPRAQYEVREVEAFRASSAAGAEYQQPSADGTRPGIFYINTFNLKAQPIFGMETLSLHEAAPGHHFQIAIQQELTHLPRFRRFGGYVAYAEGWALYAESLGKELGLFTDPMQYYGRLNDEQLRAMRLVVDTGLHAKGWTREQAIQFMLDNSSLAESDVVAEVERYMVWPGQALGYKVGQLRLTELRQRAEAKLGERFDLKGWHSAVLREGSMPLAVLEARLDRWVERQLGTGSQ